MFRSASAACVTQNWLRMLIIISYHSNHKCPIKNSLYSFCFLLWVIFLKTVTFV